MSIQSTAAGKKVKAFSNEQRTTENLGDGDLEIRNRSKQEGDEICVQNQPEMASSGPSSGPSSFPGASQSLRTGLRISRGRPSVKKVTLNNCLNFHFENRQPMEVRRGTFNRRRTPLNVFNREDYLQANFKFDISDAVDTDQLISTVDSKIDWEDVLEVEMAVSEDYRCPISLEAPPKCPHITPCGHVFSFSSIIQHLMNAGGPSLSCAVPCPLCYAPFVAKQLRSVRFEPKEVPRVGNHWNFRLMKRDKKCLVPEQVPDLSDLGHDSTVRYERYSVQKHVLKYFKTIAGDLAQAASQFIDEDDREDMFELQSYYLAIENLSTRARDFEARRLEKLVGQGKKKLTNEQIHTNSHNTALAIKQVFHETLGSMKVLQMEPPLTKNTLFSEPTETGEFQEDEHFDIEWKTPDPDHPNLEEDAPDLDNLSEEALPSNQHPMTHSDSYFFYQSEDGQWIFLHPVNISCLLRYYDHFENFPVQLSGRIVDIEEVIQSDSNRKRIRHLSHLPKHAIMQLVELDLSHHLPKNCLNAVNQRRVRQQKKAEEQEIIEQSYSQEDYYSAEFTVPIKQTLDMTSMPPLSSSTQQSTETEVQRQTELKQSAFSFANVTRNGHVPKNPVLSSDNTGMLESLRSQSRSGLVERRTELVEQEQHQRSASGKQKKGKKKKIVLLANSGNRGIIRRS